MNILAVSPLKEREGGKIGNGIAFRLQRGGTRRKCQKRQEMEMVEFADVNGLQPIC